MKMNKKALIIAIGVLLAALAGYTGYRFAIRGTDIIGVTTLTRKNMVIMNAKTGSEFVSGTGKLTVAEGEGLHLEYNLASGSVDVAFHSDEKPAEGSFSEAGIEGKGSLDFDAAVSGTYTVRITNHSAVGKVTVSAKK